jgi:hypothetical protein
MAVDSSGLVVKVARVFAGVILGGLLGAGVGVLALVVFPRDHFPFSSEGMLQAFFALAVLVAYTVVGVILGVVGAFCPDGHCLVGLGAGAALGLAGAVSVIVAVPRVLAGLGAGDSGSEVFNRGIMTIVISLAVIVAGAVIGRIRGSGSRADPAAAADRPRD